MKNMLVVVFFVMSQMYCVVHATTLRVKNVSSSEVTLSDLIVYGAEKVTKDEDGNEIKETPKEVLLSPNDSGDDKTDDIKLKKDGTDIFDTDIDVVRYVASILTNNGQDEAETSVITVKAATTHFLSWIVDPDTFDPLFLQIDGAIGITEFSSGAILAGFVDGTNVLYPDLFIGSSFDFDTGSVISPYTGDAQIVAGSIAISLIDEPGTIGLMLLSLVLMFNTRSLRANKTI